MVFITIHHWRILWSSYKKLAWVGFEPTITEFRSNSNQLSYQVMSSTRSKSQLCIATPILSFIQCLISFRLLYSSVATLCVRCKVLLPWIYVRCFYSGQCLNKMIAKLKSITTKMISKLKITIIARKII